jgi:hypothetical protein
MIFRHPSTDSRSTLLLPHLLPDFLLILNRNHSDDAQSNRGQSPSKERDCDQDQAMIYHTKIIQAKLLINYTSGDLARLDCINGVVLIGGDSLPFFCCCCPPLKPSMKSKAGGAVYGFPPLASVGEQLPLMARKSEAGLKGGGADGCCSFILGGGHTRPPGP